MSVSLSIFTWDPVHPYGQTIVDPAVVLPYAGTPLVSAFSSTDRPRLRVRAHFRGAIAKYAAIRDFWIARRGPVELFYFRPRIDYAKTSVTPTGAVNGSNTVYTVPADATYGGDYPIDDANAVLTVNGTPVSKTVDTDGRTFTAAAAPAGGTTVRIAYYAYRKFRFVGEEFPTSYPAVGTYEFDLEMREEST